MKIQKQSRPVLSGAYYQRGFKPATLAMALATAFSACPLASQARANDPDSPFLTAPGSSIAQISRGTVLHATGPERGLEPEPAVASTQHARLTVESFAWATGY